ncbi:MAG TPA: SusD/RagB family nutrient-binding outer membrane lipoprotein [Bacteroidales bacterium]|mgnify:CR=1 FL=1|nr:SusD/RagB family nutrient-binding outer membrane lipoprotein [Bacteroidales bacterium]HPS61881.1 SusD/RagB family nutrient-binding outer membrane lipoprotein [Bacteroidales bacterium]
MKRISAYIISAALFLGLITLYSCTKDFEDINTDPNNPSIEQAAPDMLLTSTIKAMTDRVHEIFLGHEMGSCWAQQMAKVQYTDEDRYIPRASVINNSWRSFYSASGMDAQTILKVGHDNYKGVALVLHCYISSVLTDLFGPIPYTQAWKGDEYLLPAFDSQETVYRDMIAKLEEANGLLNPDGQAINGDILYKNDISKWKKFANSLRLRLLLRMSARDGQFVATEMKKMLADPTTYPIFESSADNAALQYLGAAPNNNPINENRKTRDDHRVSKNFVDLLVNTYGDYRIMVFANPDALGTFDGIPNGLTSALAAAYNGNGLANTSKIGDYFSAATAPGQLMSYAELQFILAEAAVRNYIDGGMAQAKTYYVAGITGSFDQYRTPLQAIFTENAGGNYGGLSIPDGYTVDDEIAFHTTDATAPSYFDEGSITKADALKLIAEERYIATFDQGLQSWFEWRRSGFPVLTPAQYGENGGKIPIRVNFPSDEYATNPGSVAAAKNLLGGPDDLNTPVWWDTENPN